MTNSTIRNMGQRFAADRNFTLDEAKQVIAQAKQNGIVSKSELSALREIVRKYGSSFAPGALDVIQSLLSPAPPPPPPPGTQPINLDPAGGNRPVWLNAGGVFTASADGKSPANDLELGDALFKAAEVADNSKTSILGTVPLELREKTFDVNPDSKVIAGGWYEPKKGEAKDVVRFTEQKGKDGKTEYVMTFNARYSHMSEEAMRATTVYEFNRYLQDSGKLRMDPVDAKLGGLLAFGQSLDVDEGYRDSQVWATFLERYNLPETISLSQVRSALAAHSGHNYAGDAAGIRSLKQAIGPDALDALKRAEVGVPVTVI